MAGVSRIHRNPALVMLIRAHNQGVKSLNGSTTNLLGHVVLSDAPVQMVTIRMAQMPL